VHLNLETHEEITTFECVRVVEEVGPDVMGIVFDSSNVLQRGEDPVMAAKRVAPYVRQTHLKDVALWFGEAGVHRQARVCGDGVVDFRAVVPILLKANPSLNLTIENQTARGGIGLTEIYDPEWSASHRDLSLAEFASWIRLVRGFERRVERGETEPPDVVQARPFGYDEAVAYIDESAALLRSIVARIG
jgi:sugar phosphate isomerase/epimerase